MNDVDTTCSLDSNCHQAEINLDCEGFLLSREAQSTTPYMSQIKMVNSAAAAAQAETGDGRRAVHSGATRSRRAADRQG